eukprot:COSAG01_NODE_14161_length_1489_cov_1.278417_2_plen_58_part_00
MRTCDLLPPLVLHVVAELLSCAQWDVQEEVKAVHALMQKQKIPVWMDVNGGMSTSVT